MGNHRFGLEGFVLAAAVGACGGGTGQLKHAHGTAYDTKASTVWSATIEALKDDYPIVKVLDKDKRRIVTCWRVVDRENRDPGSRWRLFRVIVEISHDPPYRVAVAGRAADYSPPLIRPFRDGDGDEPGWREGRTERVIGDIHERLKQFAAATPTETPAAQNPDAQEVQSDTCVIHPEQMGVDTHGMRGIAIGEKGAMLLPD